MTQDLVDPALMATVCAKHPRPELLHHSYCGSQCCAHDYQARLKHFDLCFFMMSRRANWYDNAAMESFWGTIKANWWHLRRYETCEQAQREITEYTSTYFPTARDGIPSLGIFRLRRLPNSGHVNSCRHEAIPHGVTLDDQAQVSLSSQFLVIRSVAFSTPPYL